MTRKYDKLPDNAKRVFEGITYDVFQWEQKMFDGSFKTFEMLKRADVTTIIATVGDKIILQEQEQPHKEPFISFPGGRCEKGEEASETAKRELLEETGYASDDFFFWKMTELSSSIFWNNHYFIARNCQKKDEPRPDNGEKIKNSLISFDEFLMLSEDERFRHKDLIPFLYHLRLHPEEQAKFKKLLFGE